ncbi:class I SAM-dependent methyltransferase [candidate division WWE3 bacterium]|jgi:2-polyprenyl-3-methyl-5-hydroxy-6-metoxy-1,4-benzoquinol methylase|uniref:Class I SAM-dependent methyltransferase n=1 Tax=candidate division WWE3 bacterium TaxID=2053526 RepID=A0A3A4ZC35_UNCKA|nr:MAG: class I SAM-dependent methyltransferase [candidate division WWE3 bacterium]
MTNCRICNNTNITTLELPKFKLDQCSDCGYAQLSKYPSEEEVEKIYKDNYFEEKRGSDHINDSKMKFEFVEKFIKKDGLLLDFGCGTGNFLKSAKEAGYNVCGFDVSEYAAEYVKTNLNIETKSGKFNEDVYAQESIDAVTSFDVIEHLTNFEYMVDCFKTWLKPGGYLFLTTPDIKSWDAVVLKKNWYGFQKYPEHINFFTSKSLRILLESQGFKVEKVKVWGFVRSFEYIFTHWIKNSKVQNISLKVLRALHLQNIEIYIPMVDLMLVAKKD